MKMSLLEHPFIRGMRILAGHRPVGKRWVLPLLWLMTHPVWADWSDAELKAMPPYCEARLNRTPAYQTWAQSLGPDFLHTHHLCYAIGSLIRYPGARNKMQQQGLLNDALNNLDYMLQHASPSYVLMPEVHMYRGQAYAYHKKPALALNALGKALELNPKLITAYLLAADQYLSFKRKDQALEIVTQGLRHNPDNKRLKRRYEELGGKMPYPEPLQPAALPASPAAAAPARAVPPQGEEQPQVDQAAERQAAGPASAVDSGQTAETVSSKNPWCRFCPTTK